MASENQIYKYVGLFVIVMFVAYIALKTLKFQYKVIEGLSNGSDSSNKSMLDVVADKAYESVKNRNDKVEDVIALDKYRTDYENLIIAMEEYTNNTMLSKVVSIASTVGGLDVDAPLSNQIVNDIDAANKLRDFVGTLNATMSYIDSKKSKNSYF